MLDISFIRNDHVCSYDMFKYKDKVVENFVVNDNTNMHSIAIDYDTTGKSHITHTTHISDDDKDDIVNEYYGSNVRMWIESRRFVMEWDTYEDTYFGFEVRW